MAEVTPLSSLKRRLLTGGVWAFGGRIVMVFTGLLSSAMLARLLSPQDMGNYFLAFSVVSLGAVVGSVGLPQVAVRFVAESLGTDRTARARYTVAAVLRLGLLGAIGAGLMYAVFGGAIGRGLFGAPALGALTGLIAAWIVALTLQNLLAETLRGFHDIRRATVFGGLVTAVLLVGCLGLLWWFDGQARLSTVLLLVIACTLSSTLLAGWTLHRKVISLPAARGLAGENRISPGEVLRVAWPLLVTNIALFALAQADLWIVGAFRPQQEVAIYGAAARVVALVGMPLLAVNAVLPPVIAEMYAQDKKRELERALRGVATLAGIPAFLAVAVFALAGQQLLGLVYGDYYREGATVLTLLSLGRLANTWAGACGLTLVMSGHQALLMAVTGVCGILTVSLALFAAGPYGTTGVAVAAAGGLALQNVSMWLAVRLTTGIWTHISLTALPELARTIRKGSL